MVHEKRDRLRIKSEIKFLDFPAKNNFIFWSSFLKLGYFSQKSAKQQLIFVWSSFFKYFYVFLAAKLVFLVSSRLFCVNDQSEWSCQEGVKLSHFEN